MLARTIHKNTPLVINGQLDVTLIYPACDPAYEQLAQKLASAIQQVAGNAATLLPDCAVIPSINCRLPDAYRQHPLILLGNLNTNRALLPLYARYYCFTDAIYPGGDGYDLRTLVNPYGQSANVILAGGSRLAGVQRAVDRLIAHIQAAASDSDLVLPFLLEIQTYAKNYMTGRMLPWPSRCRTIRWNG
jgi:hypothetical protein